MPFERAIFNFVFGLILVLWGFYSTRSELMKHRLDEDRYGGGILKWTEWSSGDIYSFSFGIMALIVGILITFISLFNMF